ncbi:MAG: PDZ domain-containing protein, partial [Chloroflexi bacterium]|nr:PDZ domain-containing protein [Chloroflexota bacterium]
MGKLRLLVVASLVIAACQAIPGDIADQIVPPKTEYKTFEAAYHVLLERHVDKPGSEQLLTGALDGAQAYLTKPADQKGAACASVTVSRPTFSGSTESDLAKAGDALDKAAAQCTTSDKVQLERAATDGMAKSMNECHTYYLDPDRAKSFNQPPQPYSGIGATIIAASVSGGLAEISSVFPSSPAEKAGVRAGDRIKMVDATDVTGFAPDEIAARIRGPEATQVKLVLVRGTQELEFTITRATLTPPRVIDRAYESGQIVQVSISQLNGNVAQQTQDAVRKGVAAGAKAFILDLRDDPGGDLSAAVDIASIFLKNATLVYQVGRDGKKEEVRTNDRMFIGFQGPVVVLVNQRSASGAEIVAAGLRANGVASVVGVRTAGCVGIAQPRQMPDDGLLLVTLARMQDI